MRFMFINLPTPRRAAGAHRGDTARRLRLEPPHTDSGRLAAATGAQVRITDALSVIDGPFVEAKEVIGGYDFRAAGKRRRWRRRSSSYSCTGLMPG